MCVCVCVCVYAYLHANIIHTNIYSQKSITTFIQEPSEKVDKNIEKLDTDIGLLITLGRQIEKHEMNQDIAYSRQTAYMIDKDETIHVQYYI